MKNAINIFLACMLFLLSGVASAATPFPMPEEYFVKAKMPMHLVYPRPDSETQAHARHRWAHPEMPYEIPIGVQGGAWPFKYELIKAPSGAEIGSLYGDDNYGSITWTPSTTSGTVEFVVRITDQELNTVEAKWKVTIDANQFVFVKAGAAGAKTGTISQPLGSFAEWFKAPKDATYLNKILVLREGVYSLVSDPAEKNNMRITAEHKTPSMIGFPGENPIIDGSNAKIMVSNLLDIFIAGITWRNARNDVPDAHYLWLTGDVSRSTFWKNTFRDMQYGTSGKDNTGPVFISTTVKPKQNLLFKENLIDSVRNANGNGTYLTIYRSSYVLIEQNTIKNSSTNTGINAKATISFITIRANQATENVEGTQIGLGYGTAVSEVPHDHEICWNRISVPSTQDGPAMFMATSDYYKGQSYNTFIYRNTIVNGYSIIRFAGKTPFETDANVIVTKNPKLWDTTMMTTDLPNVVAAPTAGVVSLTARFIGNDFGKVGADVAVKPAPVSPLNPKYN